MAKERGNVVGQRDDTLDNTIEDRQTGPTRITPYRALHVNLRDNDGDEPFTGGSLKTVLYDAAGNVITDTSENGDNALDVHVSNSSIEQTEDAVHDLDGIASMWKDTTGDVRAPVVNTSGNPMTDLIALTGIGSGQKTVSSAGTAEALSGATTVRSVTIKALAGNTNNVYVGDSGVDSTNGFVLASGETLSLDYGELNDIYVDVDTNGEGVSFIYLS